MSKKTKLLAIILLMPVFAAVIWFVEAKDAGDMANIRIIIPLVVMVIGSLISLRAMRDSVSDVLAVLTLSYGLFLIVRGVNDIQGLSQSMLSPFSGLVLTILGAPLFVMGLGLWLKRDVSVAGIRYLVIGLGVLSFCKAFLFVHQTDLVLLSEIFISVMMICMSVCIFVVSQDRSISVYSYLQSAIRSVESIEMTMSSVSDAYILASGAQELRQMLDSGSPQPVRMVLISNKHGERQIAFRRGDDGVRFEMYAPRHSMSNPIYKLRAQDIVIMQDHLSIFAPDGNWLRIPIYDSILPNYDNALIFGHEVDLRRYVKSFSRNRLLKKRIQEKVEMMQAPVSAANYYPGNGPGASIPVPPGMSPQGQEIRNPDGSVYRGMLDERGLFTGLGVYYYPNGDRFEGTHVAGIRNGQGCYFWADGSWTSGSYVNGVREGPTTMFTVSDGFTYTGNASNDRFVGILRISRNGRLVYEGECDDNRPCGDGVLYVDGGRIIGQWNPDGTCVGTFHGQDGSAMPTDPGVRYI